MSGDINQYCDQVVIIPCSIFWKSLVEMLAGVLTIMMEVFIIFSAQFLEAIWWGSISD